MSSLPVTTPWVGPGPQSPLACPVHLTSVWVVCYINPSRNLMPSSQCICLVDFQWEGQGCLPAAQSLTATSQHSQAAAGGCPLQSQGLAAGRASWSQLHLSGTETMRRDSLYPGLSTSPFWSCLHSCWNPQPLQLLPRYAEEDSRLPRWLPQLKESAGAEACLLLATRSAFILMALPAVCLSICRLTSSPPQDFHIVYVFHTSSLPLPRSQS